MSMDNTMESHQHEESNQSVLCPYRTLGCETECSHRSLCGHMQNDELQHSQRLNECLHNLKNEVSSLSSRFEERIVKLERESGRQMERINALKYERDMNRDKIAELQVQCRQFEELRVELVRLANKTEIIERKITSVGPESANIENTENMMIDDGNEDETFSIVGESETNTENNATGSNTNGNDNMLNESRNTTEITETENTNQNIDLHRTSWNISEMIFRVIKFNKRTDEEKVRSPSFYSHQNGYKMQLVIYPKRNQFFKSYTEVYFRLCQGEYDDTLVWPCKMMIIVSIVNQNTNLTYDYQSIYYGKVSNDDKYKWDKPTTDYNDRLLVLWKSHSDIRSATSHNVLVNDSIVIKCVVPPPM